MLKANLTLSRISPPTTIFTVEGPGITKELLEEILECALNARPKLPEYGKLTLPARLMERALLPATEWAAVEAMIRFLAIRPAIDLTITLAWYHTTEEGEQPCT